MSGIHIVTDSSSDLPREFIDKYGISVVPLTIRFGDEEFVDMRDLTPDEFWERSRRSPTLPETAAPAPGAFGDAYAQAAAAGKNGVVCITISAGLSATNQAAYTAAQGNDLPLPVKVIDSRLVTLAQGLVVLTAAEAASSGASVEEVAGAARECVERITAFGTLDTLENLRKGGRIGGAQALLGSMLSIKPVVEIVNGVVEPESRQRTRSKALNHLIELTRGRGTPEILGVAHADASDVDGFIESLSDAFPGVELVVSRMGAVLGTHVGQGTIALVSRMAR